MNFSIEEIKCQGAIMQMRLKNATLAKLETIHETKRLKNFLKSRSITQKKKSMLEKSLRHFTRKLNLYEKQEQNLLRDLNYLRSKPDVTESTR